MRHMNAILAELELKASQLTAEERAGLALLLLQSLEPMEDGDLDEVWQIEADRRLDQIESGEVKSVPGDEVFARVRRRLR